MSAIEIVLAACLPLGLLLGGAVIYLTTRRSYVRAASYDDEGVHGDVVIVPRRGAAHD
ncbi:hypothetical protein [Ancylobacter sp.]|uniref:hypothetical protein n=1 Tax=Ancylobacter sp. TaxID=1872567 RepID=UPI003BA95891